MSDALSGMHRALFVAEILLEIFTYLTPLEEPALRDEILTSSGLPELFWVKSPLLWDIRSRGYLAALARTCKTFHEPAMYLLWADTHDYGIEPLLGCVARLHPLIYQRDGMGSWPQSFEPRDRTWSEGIEPLSEHETQQFLRHAARVRYLSIRQTKNHLGLLTAFPIETRIFPRLLALKWFPDTNVRMHLFLSPTLRRCALRAVHPDFKSIGTRFSGLESLSLWNDDREDFRASDVSLLSETVRSCKQLKHLRCSSLDSAAWKHLSNLPDLATILMYGALNEVALDLDGVILTPFLNVTSLYFRLDSTLNIITILQHSKFPLLKEFRASVDALHCSEAEQLCHALMQCNASHTLQYVSINSFNPADERPDKPLAVIRPLFCLPQLRYLSLTPYLSIDLDNDLLLEAMSSWPHIHTLDLNSTAWL